MEGEQGFRLWYTFQPGGKKVRKTSPPTTYDSLFPSDPRSPYQLPYQKKRMLQEYWPVRYAARRWGCTYRAARLYILRHPGIGVLIRIQARTAPKPRWIIAVMAGTIKVPAMKGNPDLLDPHWQRRYAIERWRRKRQQDRSPVE